MSAHWIEQIDADGNVATDRSWKAEVRAYVGGTKRWVVLTHGPSGPARGRTRYWRSPQSAIRGVEAIATGFGQ